jgi:hypothetical protein
MKRKTNEMEREGLITLDVPYVTTIATLCE